jgi:hypothetical protein
MKSSTRNLIIAGVAALVLGGGVFALNKFGGGEASSSAADSSETIQLISKTSKDVASMTVTNKNGSYTITPLPAGAVGSGSDSSSVNFTVKELEGCPVNTDRANAVVQNGISLGALKNIGKVDNMKDFGLTDPQATVEVKYKDGSDFGYKIGNATATSSAYYMCGLDSDNVYVVAVDKGILEASTYFVETEMLSISPDTSDSSSSSSSSNEQNVFQKITLTGKNFPTETVIQDIDEMPTIVAPAKYEVDAQYVANMQGVLESLTADSAVVVKPDAAALKKYGIDNPTVKAVYTVNKENHKLIIGNKSSKGYYAMVDDINVIFDVSADDVSALTDMNLFKLRSKLIFLPNITTVKKIEITSPGKTDTIIVTRTENTESSTEDNKAYDYKVTGTNGKELDYDKNYKNAYQTLIGLVIYDQTDKKPAGKPEITVTYSYFDKSTTDTLALYATDSRHYTAVLNDTVYGLCTKNDVENILNTIADFEAGKSVKAS